MDIPLNFDETCGTRTLLTCRTLVGAPLLEWTVLREAVRIVDYRDIAVVEVDDLAVCQVGPLAVAVGHGARVGVEVEGGSAVRLGRESDLGAAQRPELSALVLLFHVLADVVLEALMAGGCLGGGDPVGRHGLGIACTVVLELLLCPIQGGREIDRLVEGWWYFVHLGRLYRRVAFRVWAEVIYECLKLHFAQPLLLLVLLHGALREAYVEALVWFVVDNEWLHVYCGHVELGVLLQLLLLVELCHKLRLGSRCELFLVDLWSLGLHLLLDLREQMIQVVPREDLFHVLVAVLRGNQVVDDPLAVPGRCEAVLDHLLHSHLRDFGSQALKALLHFDHLIVLLLILGP